MCSIRVDLKSTSIRNIIRCVFLTHNDYFTVNDIISECKSIGIDDVMLTYSVLDDLCRKGMIMPKGSGYMPAEIYANAAV